LIASFFRSPAFAALELRLVSAASYRDDPKLSVFAESRALILHTQNPSYTVFLFHKTAGYPEPPSLFFAFDGFVKNGFALCRLADG
jgi:hypothetical protein